MAEIAPSIIAAAASGISAIISAYTAWKTTRVKSELDKQQALLLKADERNFDHKIKRTEDFIKALLDAIRLGNYVKLALINLRKTSYSPEVRTSLFLHTTEPHIWIEQGMIMSNLRSTVLLGMSDADLFDRFIIKVNENFTFQTEIYNSFYATSLTNEVIDSTIKDCENYFTSSSEILLMVRSLVISTDTLEVDRFTEAVLKSLKYAGGAKFSFNVADQFPYWAAVWPPADGKDSKTFAHDLSNFARYVQESAGALDIDSNLEEGPGQGKLLQIKVYFATRQKLDEFVDGLALVTPKTKSLWIGPSAAKTWSSRNLDRPQQTPQA
jgi:hypothetical protein